MLADMLDRVQKLKDARSEAAKEIEEYKAKKEAEYKKFETEVSAATYRCLDRFVQCAMLLEGKGDGLLYCLMEGAARRDLVSPLHQPADHSISRS